MDAVSMKSSDQRTRRSANFTPSLWKEYLLRLERQVSTYDFKKEEFCEQEREHERLKEVVRMMLTEPGVGSGPQTLDLIDIIERLGLFYHFECEIQALMLTSKLEHGDEYDDHDLHKVALRFRLLRQLGHYVSCDVFNKFKDQEGNFKESLVTDVRGLLGLFEAAHYRVHEEDILGEALNFTTSQLVSMLPNLDHFWTPRVKQALEVPIQKTLNRIGARRFISLYEEDTSHNAVLLKFAKLDFNILQRLHQKELLNEAKWWNSLNAAENFPFARDRLVECSFWTLGVYFEPKYSEARQSLAKVIAMVSIVDDIYDSYGFLDELLLFMDSIERWHISALDQLPSYMGQCYRALLNVYNEIEERLAKEGKSDLINYAISSVRTCYI
ncbi:OLC1v1029375C1 [Oldenlandia corymbosa var. corymbosa]|uniref:OLC1v1029375C1 n=1 Tax=Oldenlandia corymbosa var. corymbosa TaxID=529605 RepID=A0AAV1CH44_OLDCO|nr:OLC1v1029375C1 [Oldenlandia corymbosa var. corymbosa]